MTAKTFNAEDFFSVLMSKKFDIRKPILLAEALFEEPINNYDELFKNAVLYFKDEEIATRFCTIITNSKIIDTKETKMLISCVKRII